MDQSPKSEDLSNGSSSVPRKLEDRGGKGDFPLCGKVPGGVQAQFGWGSEQPARGRWEGAHSKTNYSMSL